MLAQSYQAGCGRLVRLRLYGRSGLRSPRRICIVAPLAAGGGVAAGARFQLLAMRKAGFDAEIVDASAALGNPLARCAHKPATMYVIHGQGPQTARLLGAVLPAAAQAWRVAYWGWDLPDPPADWTGCDNVVSEIWAPSQFARCSLLRIAERPIHVMPPVPPAAEAPRRRPWGEPFTVLAMAGDASAAGRRNAEAAMDAFLAAFGDAPDARLVVKASGPGQHLQALRARAAGRPNITLIEAWLDAAALAALYRAADAIISLHRATGDGLALREAMSHGVPAVATAWSGNCEFMTAENAVLVPYRLAPIADPAMPQQFGVWAEPDIGFAAAALRRLQGDASHYRMLAKAAHESVRAMEFQLPQHGFAPEVRRDRLRARVLSQLGQHAGRTRLAP